jgi:hypothetical protein
MTKLVVIYGHKLYSHTHSFIHYGFYKAFVKLGYEIIWMDDNDYVSLDFSNAIFLTEGQVDTKIPLVKSAKYILHNCNLSKYIDIPNKINLQYWHNGIEGTEIPSDQHETFIAKSPVSKENSYTWVSKETLYQPWATDLLPDEIDTNTAHNEMDNKECFWAGTYGGADSKYQNASTLDPFFLAAEKEGIMLKRIDPWSKAATPEENKILVNKAYLAPALNGQWQADNGYISCRVFKNISYGHLGIINSPKANDLFYNQLVYDTDTKKLCHKAIEQKQQSDVIEKIRWAMNEVREKHTYINRAQQILRVIGAV